MSPHWITWRSNVSSRNDRGQQAPNLADMAEFSCRNVWERGKPVLCVFHTSDGHWEMNCGGYEHEDDNEILILHKAHLVARDPTLEPTLDLPEGWEARRETFSADWVREPQTAE